MIGWLRAFWIARKPYEPMRWDGTKRPTAFLPKKSLRQEFKNMGAVTFAEIQAARRKA